MHRIAILAPAVLLCGCVRYQARPLDPPALEKAFLARRLDDPGLREFAAARNSGWPPERLNEASLTLAAWYFSADLEAARARMRTAQAAVVTARARPNPGLSLGGGPTDSPESAIVAHFDPVLTLETAGKRGLRVLAAQKRAEAARVAVAETGWQVRSRVRNAWLDYTYARRSVRELEAEDRARAARVRVLAARFAAGQISRPELNVERASFISTEVALAAARGQAADGLAKLAEAAGVPVSALDGYPTADPPPPPEALPADMAQEAGLLNRTDLRRSLLEYAAADAALRLEIARQYPDIDVSPGYSFDEGHHKFQISPSFPVPLWNRNRGPIAEAEGRREEAGARFAALQARAIGEIERARLRYRAALEELRHADRQWIELQAVSERAALLAVREGEGDRLALTGVRIEGTLAARARLEAVRRAETALADLEDAVERPLDAGTADWKVPERSRK